MLVHWHLFNIETPDRIPSHRVTRASDVSVSYSGGHNNRTLLTTNRHLVCLAHLREHTNPAAAMDVAMSDPVLEDHPRTGPIVLVPEAATSATASLKRSAAEAFEEASDDEASHKKMRDDTEVVTRGGEVEQGKTVDGPGLADNLEEELQCGCCSAIVYRPVVVAPCQHFFCGRYVGAGSCCQ